MSAVPGQGGLAAGVAAQGEFALVENRQQERRIGVAAAELERLGIGLAPGLVPAQRQHRFAEPEVGAKIGAVDIAREGCVQAVRSLCKEAQLQAVARAFRQPVGAARIEPGNDPEHPFVLRRQCGGADLVQLFALQRAAEPPVEAATQREVSPGRDPLRRLVDGIGAHLLVAPEAVVVTRPGARLDPHPALEKQEMPVVVPVSHAAERLLLCSLVQRRNGVLMEAERVLAESDDAELACAVGDLDQREPGARQQRLPGGIGPIGAFGRRHFHRLGGLRRQRVQLLERRVGQAMDS